MTTASKCACGESLEGYAPSGEGIVQCDKCGKRYCVQRSATQSTTLSPSTTVEVSELGGHRMDRVAWIAAGIAGGVLIAMVLVFAVEKRRGSTAGVDATISSSSRKDSKSASKAIEKNASTSASDDWFEDYEVFESTATGRDVPASPKVELSEVAGVSKSVSS